MKPDPVVVIAGSRDLPPGLAPRILIRFLANLPTGSRVLLRRGLTTKPNGFELQVESLCDLIGIPVEWRQPVVAPPWEDADEYVGRQQTFARDLDMITRSDVVLCFYTVDQIGDDTSGTVALVDKALEANKIVYAYALDGEAVIRVGEHDPSNEWGERVPTPA